MSDKAKKFILGICFITIACYANTLKADFVWDDFNNVVNNDHLEKSESMQDIFLHTSGGYYRPISYLSIRFDHAVWGKNPLGYHLTNLFFHVLNSLMVFMIAGGLCLSERASFLAALLFAVHPVHTEAVAYISGRSDIIAAFFIFSSFHFFLKSFKLNNILNKNTIISLIFFMFALFCKEIALIVPVLVACFVFVMGDSSLAKKIKYIIPFFAIDIIFLLFWQTSIRGNLVTPHSLEINTDFFKIMLFYVSILIFPINLHMQRSLSESVFLAAIPLSLSMLVFFSGLYILKKIFTAKFFNFAVLWFIIGLFPFWGWLEYSAQIAEHWLYIPSLGWFLFLGHLGGMVIKIKSGKFSFVSKVSIFTVLLVLLSLTIRQNKFWKDDITLYKYTLEFKSEDASLRYNLGNAYLRNNMLNDAERAYYHALRLRPDYARALNNLAIVRERLGDHAQALKFYKLVHRLDPAAGYAQNNLIRLIGIEPAFAFEKNEQKFDHALYVKILSEYTDNGWINYKGLKENISLLNEYLQSIAMLDKARFKAMSKQEKMALYINAYNAFTIKAILDHYPVQSIKNIPGVWKKLKFTIAGDKLTLDEIEHGILRPKFKDARVHFALVCAARGCPRLTGVPYTADNLDIMLDEAGKNFINDTTRNRLDKNKNVLYLSSIFKWFEKDFGKDVLDFIGKYLNKEDYNIVRAKRPKIKYQYDWTLNERN